MISGSQSVTQKSFRMNFDNENVLAQMITYECNVLSIKKCIFREANSYILFLIVIFVIFIYYYQ